ncbi:hypothetical protein SAMN05444682_103129 [Parapedobacter indicus]|uniref:Uncharacterized protein n=1 Tax=Parapedobacter indicus TaxID=1477437 RepID=A0A1I3GW84_9SPHI|nr:hypothetical protein CLV26_103130 [Parapedobacter indicus]SFI27663.1 hypothetical protein SAMN05444682_103129 [Parapedobacter indicus]
MIKKLIRKIAGISCERPMLSWQCRVRLPEQIIHDFEKIGDVTQNGQY